MPVDANSVRVGHCYAGTDGRTFKVTALVEGRVRFETLDGGGAASSGDEEPAVQEFLGRLREEVPCPEMDQPVPSQAEGERDGEHTEMDRPVPSQAEGERGQGTA